MSDVLDALAAEWAVFKERRGGPRGNWTQDERWAVDNPGESAALDGYRNGGPRPSLLSEPGRRMVAHLDAWLAAGGGGTAPAPAGPLGCPWYFTSMANWQIRGDRLTSEFRALNGGQLKAVRFYPIERGSPSSGGYWNGNGGHVRTAVVVNGTEVGFHLETNPKGAWGDGGPKSVPMSGMVPRGADVAVQWTDPAANPSTNTISIDNLGCPQGLAQPGAAENDLAFFVSGRRQSHHVPIVQVEYQDGKTDGGSGYIDVPGSAAKSNAVDIPLNLPRAASKVFVYGVSSIRAQVGDAAAAAAGGSGWNRLDLHVPAGPSVLRLTYQGTLKGFQKGTGYGFTDPCPEMPGAYSHPVYLD